MSSRSRSNKRQLDKLIKRYGTDYQQLYYRNPQLANMLYSINFASNTNTNQSAIDLAPLIRQHCELIYFINEHHAKRAGLHYDFRLAYYDATLDDCVFYSWATRKFPQLVSGRLIRISAFETELHSWNYQYFEGEIPEGYGAGINYIWEKGKYELLEWIPNQKIKVILHPGEKGRIKRKIAITLIKLKNARNPNEWLMVKSKKYEQ